MAQDLPHRITRRSCCVYVYVRERKRGVETTLRGGGGNLHGVKTRKKKEFFVLLISAYVIYGWFFFRASGFPDGSVDKESACQYRRSKRQGFHPWVGKIPWRRKWQPSPVFLHETSHGHGLKESGMTERLNRQTDQEGL